MCVRVSSYGVEKRCEKDTQPESRPPSHPWRSPAPLGATVVVVTQKTHTHILEFYQFRNLRLTPGGGPPAASREALQLNMTAQTHDEHATLRTYATMVKQPVRKLRAIHCSMVWLLL